MPQAALLTWLAVLCALFIGCGEFRDCSLYGMCSEDLEKLAKGSKGEQCADCLHAGCGQVMTECSVDMECNRSAQCLFTTDVGAYQRCLVDLEALGYSDGGEHRRPWEGESPAINDFRNCLQERCAQACSGAEKRWACEAPSNEEYDGVLAKVAVRMYPFYEVVSNVGIRICAVDRGCGEEQYVTGSDGRVDFPLPSVSPDDLYFELESLGQATTPFPKTLYYPSPLGRSGAQPLAIYLVSELAIARGNFDLNFELGVLTDKSQSLILPDSCVWETISAPDVRIRIENSEVPQCKGSCDTRTCPPCIWYAEDKHPNTWRSETDGSGAGVVGLPEGSYTLKVEDLARQVLASRKVQMKAGQMTIVRTSPRRH